MLGGYETYFGISLDPTTVPWGQTSSARAEISDGPHKGGLRRAGPNDLMFVYD